MIALHPVPYIGAPLLVLSVDVAVIATCVGCPFLALGAGLVVLLSSALMAVGGAS